MLATNMANLGLTRLNLTVPVFVEKLGFLRLEPDRYTSTYSYIAPMLIQFLFIATFLNTL